MTPRASILSVKGRDFHPLVRQGWLDNTGLSRLRQGHPWLFKRHLGPELRKLRTPQFRHVGEHWFALDPESDIPLRRLGPAARHWSFTPGQSPEAIEEEAPFLQHLGAAVKELLREAFERRSALFPGEKAFRAVFSESDGLPALVVDLFGEVAVVQIQNRVWDHFWSPLKTLLEEAAAEAGFPLREVRDRRRFAAEKAPRSLSPSWLRWNGFEWLMTPGEGQKTGAYFDQRENHLQSVLWGQRLAARRPLAPATAWDLCTHQGGFGLHLARAGWKVLAVDESAAALEVAQKNAQRNGISPDRFECLRADVFHFLKESFEAKRQSDLIVLDPPAFAKGREAVEGALRGFKELNLRALHALRPGGLLVSCACSHAVSRDDYGRMLASAAHDARRQVRILEVRGPSPDHAPLVGFPESEYLQAWFLEIR